MHRSGWSYALEALTPLHNPSGVLFDGFLDETFGWNRSKNLREKKIPYAEPWIGFLHRPPNIPDWYEPERSIDRILQDPSWLQSMPYCRGIFCLSEYMADWLRQRLDVPIAALFHPTDVPTAEFSMSNFHKNPRKKIMQIGWCLRRMHSFFELDPSGYEKVLVSAPMWQKGMSLEAAREPYEGPKGTVNVLPYQSKHRYDVLLSENIAFVHLYDSSANNAIIECMVRNTPLLVNPLPAVREYLGEGYPFYFESLKEASEKARSRETIAATHEYLKALPRERFTQESFREAFLRSAVYESLPAEL